MAHIIHNTCVKVKGSYCQSRAGDKGTRTVGPRPLYHLHVGPTSTGRESSPNEGSADCLSHSLQRVRVQSGIVPSHRIRLAYRPVEGDSLYYDFDSEVPAQRELAHMLY